MKLDDQIKLVAFLKEPKNYPHSVQHITHIETHISHLFLTGDFAYKLKKAIKFDFLDFSTREKRKKFCNEEIRLNSRFAPEIYVQVVPILEAGEKLFFESEASEGIEIDYLVKMLQFDQSTLFDRLAAEGHLNDSLLIQITDEISNFHLKADNQPSFWGVESVERILESSLAECAPYCENQTEQTKLNLLRQSLLAKFVSLQKVILNRQTTHVRALHGDLHLRNMCIFKGKVQLFDGIEFNPELSNCDVWADIAFFIMDLMFRNLRESAALVWNRYLEATDDFEGFKLLDLYVSYRALVRAKVAFLTSGAAVDETSKNKARDEGGAYLDLAIDSLKKGKTCIVAIGGISGSGKTTIASELAKRVPGVHLRSDAVRKHIAGISLLEQGSEEVYSDVMSEKTYNGLTERARHVLRAGYIVFVDAVFSSLKQREEIEELARSLSVPFVGIWCELPSELAMERVRLRKGDISDANEDVVAMQESILKESSPLGKPRWHHLNTSQQKQVSIDTAMKTISIHAPTKNNYREDYT